MLAGLPKKSINAMQCIQNIGAKIILNKKSRHRVPQGIKLVANTTQIDFKNTCTCIQITQQANPKISTGTYCQEGTKKRKPKIKHKAQPARSTNNKKKSIHK